MPDAATAVAQCARDLAVVTTSKDERGYFYRVIFIPFGGIIDDRRWRSRTTAMRHGRKDLAFKRRYFDEHGKFPAWREDE